MMKANNVDEYISRFPEETQKMLETVRATIKKAAPEAKEIISYQIPAYKSKSVLVYFAGYKNHIGFYPTSSGIKAFKKELSFYKNAKGSVQFPINKPLPLDLINKIVQFRVKEDALQQKEKIQDDYLSLLSAPAKRVLIHNGIKTLQQFSKFTESEIAKLHGIGANTISKLNDLLEKAGLSFKK